MQAIQTKYIPATNFKGSRIKATCDRGNITISYPDELSGDACHIAAADALVAKFTKEDGSKYGTDKNPWSRARVCGGLKDGTCAHVYIENHNTTTTLCLTFRNAEDYDWAQKLIANARENMAVDTATPLAGGNASILLCAIGRSK